MTLTSAPPADAPDRPRKRVAVTVGVWLLLLPGTAWAVLRLFGWERGIGVQLFAFTPYIAVAVWLPALIALAARRWIGAAVAILAAALLAVCVLPRALPDTDRGPATGVPLNVLTANVLAGSADPATIVRLVREHDVAVLAMQEFTPAIQTRLTASGLDALLPHRSAAAEYGTTGSAVYSRFPITSAGSRRNSGGFGFLQAYGTIRPPGAGPVDVESAHPVAPHSVAVLDDWRSDLREQPRPDPNGSPRILLGDFNATLDHQPLRELISHGYRNAADVDGQGLAGTWGPYGGHPLPPVTIDHVLVDRRIGVRDVRVYDLPSSDHRAVLASLTVPAG